uniref:CCHC-type domain-containing protein n=1 Tax=Branchiostoma floridae TaxID=7739 RepID=C3YIR4_BRAFL|eukprot:XP_002603777.1 hypothetical protein BRAFLDRAFT_124666 [Branchiostoma floridae]
MVPASILDMGQDCAGVLSSTDSEFPVSEVLVEFCALCRRYVAAENRHCQKCNCCTSKDGRTYVHCDLCKKCVKPAWSHCEPCGRCEPRDHVCSQRTHLAGCYICGDHGHKRRECPQRFSQERYTRTERMSGKRKRKMEATFYRDDKH